MSSESQAPAGAGNPFLVPDWGKHNAISLWREWVVKSEQQWSEAVSQILKDERAGPMLNRHVDEARLMQRMFAELAQVGLASVNMPSRSDFEAMDERLGRLEDAMAAMTAALVQLRQALVQSAVPGAATFVDAKPTRTRKPSKGSASEAAPTKGHGVGKTPAQRRRA